MEFSSGIVVGIILTVIAFVLDMELSVRKSKQKIDQFLKERESVRPYKPTLENTK